jgi:hypothetical protein
MLAEGLQNPTASCVVLTASAQPTLRNYGDCLGRSTVRKSLLHLSVAPLGDGLFCATDRRELCPEDRNLAGIRFWL